MIPISNCFQLTEEQVKKKKKIFFPVCSPTSLDPEMWNEGSHRKERADTVISRGIKPAWILSFHCSDFVLFFHLPLPSYALFIKMLKPQCSGVQHPLCRTLGCLEEICVYLQVGVQTSLLLNKDWDYILQEY